MMRLRRGRDVHGVVHYDSLIKRTYIYPMCRTPYLNLFELDQRQIVTCIGCVGSLCEFEAHWDEDAC